MSNETRKLPTRPGWWWREKTNGVCISEVVNGHGGMVVAASGCPVADSLGDWLAPIPGPEVLAALAEYGEALVGADASQPKSRERVLARGRLVEAGIAMANAIRAERDGAA